MSEPLPVGGFEFLRNTTKFTEKYIKNLDRRGKKGFFFEVSLSYPPELHELHDEYPLCPEHLKVTEDYLSQYQKAQAKKLGINTTSEKLCCTLEDKNNTVLHFW